MDDKIVAIFEKWVKKLDDLGNGNFGVKKGFLDPNLEVRANNTFDGSFFYSSPVFASVYNCGSASAGLARDLETAGFQTKMKYTVGAEGFTQNYVEVFVPDEQRWVQLDVTPWYRKIGTSHVETGEHPRDRLIDDCSSFTGENEGQFLSTQRQPDGSFVDVYLAGNYVGLRQHIDILERATKSFDISKSLLDKQPVYQFCLFARQAAACAEKQTARAEIVFEIMDAAKIADVKSELSPSEWLQHPTACLEKLVECGAARVLICGYGDYLLNFGASYLGLSRVKGGKSFDYLKVLKARGCTPISLLDWLEANIDAMANVVFHVGEYLETRSGEMLKCGLEIAIV